MAFPTEDFMLNFAGDLVNHGTKSNGNLTATQGSSPTNYTLTSGGGTYDGYLSEITQSGSSMPYFDHASAAAYASTIVDINVALGFLIDSSFALDNSVGNLICSDKGSPPGGFRFRLLAATLGGDFDLECLFASTSGTSVSQLYAVTKNTLYDLAGSIDTSNQNACQARFNLNGSATAPGTIGLEGMAWTTANPTINAAGTFTNIRGFKGKIFYATYGRGQTAWTASNLATIVADPKNQIGGWPGGGGLPMPRALRNCNQIRPLYRR